VSARIFAGDLPSSASKVQFRRPAAQDGGTALVGKTEAESPDRYRGRAGPSLAVLVEPGRVVSKMRRALMQTLIERPIANTHKYTHKHTQAPSERMNHEIQRRRLVQCDSARNPEVLVGRETEGVR
jgi:hypothetical protein